MSLAEIASVAACAIGIATFFFTVWVLLSLTDLKCTRDQELIESRHSFGDLSGRLHLASETLRTVERYTSNLDCDSETLGDLIDDLREHLSGLDKDDTKAAASIIHTATREFESLAEKQQ